MTTDKTSQINNVPTLSEAQWKMIRILSREPNGLAMNIGGHGRGPYLSSCRALVRRGLVYAGHITSHYGLTATGRNLVAEAMARKPASVTQGASA